MVKFPVHVTRDGYRGANQSRRAKAQSHNETAAALEAHINRQLESQTEPIKSYSYSILAHETRIPREVVARMCFSIDCGHNGFTVIRKDLTYEQALKEIEVGR